jgi:hypothetical protein
MFKKNQVTECYVVNFLDKVTGNAAAVSLPLSKTNANTFAKEATRHTTDATKVRNATSFNLEAFQSTLNPAPSLNNG